jgi:hypothetical protein
MIEKCSNVIQETGRACGDDVDGPFHLRFCSEGCADRTNKVELEELGITPTMMRDALEGYYACRDQIHSPGQNEDEEGGPETASLYPASSSPDEPSSS